MEVCNLCPRKCGVDRNKSLGFCKAPNMPKLARAALHFWEEPCISGSRGSGTVFFSGCNLKCVYCQNYSVSQEAFGREVSVERLGEIFLELQSMGAHNINLVTPTPYIPQIISAIDIVRNQIKIPFVYNTGGYEALSTLDMLEGYIDIYLTDIKYKSCEMSKKYSGAEDYFEVALNAAKKMINQAGTPEFDKDGMMKSGVIVRHLVLPGGRQDSINILREMASELPTDRYLLSLMSQYTPNKEQLKNFPEICRRVTTFEYDSVLKEAIGQGLDRGFMQMRSSAEQKYTPSFDLEGVQRH